MSTTGPTIEAGEWRCTDGHLNSDRFSVCCVCDLNDEGEPTRRLDDDEDA